MQNLSFACLGHNQNTTFAVLVINEQNRIIDSKADLHDLHAADDFTHTKYDHELTIGECYANYEAWRNRNHKSQQLLTATNAISSSLCYLQLSSSSNCLLTRLWEG